ncbi:N-acetylmuramoyl-L-alanine amidase [Deinococcus sp. Marseille-Q6407]|uniref:N-acetylmuramoyl-L-alanine amidase family protein n=1 Tax=Deinococcus sp. Marseille-Q6407 TaxID=2969223 RepID=UPI0021C07F30|nr:N-acetylmuramoyl-L-alanine amidase [Deinococcus sp. Marseille-Q6407]
MKSRALFLSMLVGSAGWASAQTDPFQRTGPSTDYPAFAGNAAAFGAGGQSQAQAQPAAAQTVAQARPASNVFGSPRFSSPDGITKVVFDLPAGAHYVLSPAEIGLTVRVEGAPVQPETRGAVGPAVTGYQAGGRQAVLSTPFPLGPASGWRASEATIASGNRVLILEIGESVQGGVSGGGLRAMVGGSAAPAAAPARAAANASAASYGNSALSSTTLSLSAMPLARSSLDRSDNPYQLAQVPVQPAPAPLVVTPTYTPPVPAPRPAAAPAAIPAAPGGTAPGDQVVVSKPQPLPPELADAPGYTANGDLSGRVPGSAGSGTLTEPRIGKNPGITRVVVDLPPGSSYKITPQGDGLSVAISGVRSQGGGASGVSPELAAWAYRPGGNAVNLSLQTGSPTTSSRGWRAFFLPPVDGGTDRYRLAIDVSPALANLRPLPAQERRLSTMASLPAAGGLAYASAVKPRVVLDPGHGGSDPGAMGSVQEKKLVLDVALRTRQFLQAAGIDVIMTRDRDMELNPSKVTDLRMRGNMGASGNAFVSIHANAMPTQSALKGYGVETWYNGNHRLSPALATIMQKNVVDTSGAFSRGIKNYQSLAVLRNNRVPAVLVEVGFVSHPVDSINLTDQNYLDRVALGIAKGIHESLRTGVRADSSEAVGQLPGNPAD